MLSVKFRISTLESIAETAKSKGMTQKDFVATALQAAGVTIAEGDITMRKAYRRRG